LVNLTAQRGIIKLVVWAAISFEIKKPLIFILRDRKNENYWYTARSYILAPEDGLLIIQSGQPFQQDNAQIYTARITEEWTRSMVFGWWTGHLAVLI